MQVSISFIALSVLSLCAARAVPRFTPAGQAPSPGPTDASWPTVPESLVAAYRASQNSTSGLTKRDVHCETSGGSPPAGDVNAAIHTLDAVAANSCQQSNGGGSFCTTMGCSGAACVGICGPFLGSTICANARDGLNAILNTCNSGGLVGGFVDGSDGLSFNVFHS
ncbi:hypothetical protein C8J57DRAFT_1212987 [Mycena rebaudengoi]|nr:hypothetical protein C8J57DRAFT_1212987 [Mycena rebaudengoi]